MNVRIRDNGGLYGLIPVDRKTINKVELTTIRAERKYTMNELMINTNDLPIFQNKTLNSATKKDEQETEEFIEAIGEIISEYETICPEMRGLLAGSWHC